MTRILFTVMSSSTSKSILSPTCASAEDMVLFSLSLTGVSSSSTNPFRDVKSVCVGCDWTVCSPDDCVVLGVEVSTVWARADSDTNATARDKYIFKRSLRSEASECLVQTRGNSHYPLVGND